jgi:hypothetical protein
LERHGAVRHASWAHRVLPVSRTSNSMCHTHGFQCWRFTSFAHMRLAGGHRQCQWQLLSVRAFHAVPGSLRLSALLIVLSSYLWPPMLTEAPCAAATRRVALLYCKVGFGQATYRELWHCTAWWMVWLKDLHLLCLPSACIVPGRGAEMCGSCWGTAQLAVGIVGRRAVVSRAVGLAGLR